MSISNPRPKKLVVIKVNYRDNEGTTNFLFPLNPTEFTVNQSNRISSIFTYGEKIFQNLGRGLKTVTISGHTGHRLDYNKYGIFSSVSDSIESQTSVVSGSKLESRLSSVDRSNSDGARLFLDLYSLIQLVKGENVFLDGTTERQIKSQFSVENIDSIENVQLIIPDQSIVYDVILQNDSFMRSREQPHMYKYQLSFVVTNEAVKVRKSLPTEGFAKTVLARLGLVKDATTEVDNGFAAVEEAIKGIPGVSVAVTAYDDLLTGSNALIQYFTEGTKEFNKRVNDLRRLEKINDVLRNVSSAISTVRSSVQILQTFDDVSDAFYETKINGKRIQRQANLLYDQFSSQKDELSFKVSLQRLASISVPITIAANKATIGMLRKDITTLNKSGFVIQIEEVKEIDTVTGRKISIVFSQAPSSLGISDIKIYATNDYSHSNNLVASLTDDELIMSVSFFRGGRIYDFQIEYDYKTFEQISQTPYKSIRRVLIKDGDDFLSLIKLHAPEEYASISTYESEVAYLNEVEFPYIVTRSQAKYAYYLGSHAFNKFSTNEDFLKYISNITITGTEGQPLPLYTYADVKDSFIINETDLVTDLLPSNVKFFVLLFKETYSNRIYALFGLFTDLGADEAYLFQAESYYLIAVEKGKSYEITENVIWEILSPYTLNDDLVDFYGQRDYLDSLDETDLFTRDAEVIKNIYSIYVGSFSHDSFIFTADDKEFLAGDVDNKQYVILTNFISVPDEDSFDVTAYKKFRILTDKQYLLLPSLSDKFLSFQNARNGKDVYKTDLDLNFITHEIIHERPDLGVGQGEVDFVLINGLANVKQALYHRLITPKGGLKLHIQYGLPQLLGKKNTLENLVMLKYNIFEQVTSDNRVRNVASIEANSDGDEMSSDVSVVLVNNDEITVR